MATIRTPGAGVSPYQNAAAADPSVLTTTVNGRPSLVASTTVVNGQAALNGLITTNQTGVFQGANVTINLEEQNFNTTNQVTSTTNYPSGNTGEIQFNSGANSFTSDPYFTYASSNVVTPGIRTDGYFYSNGAPFIGGGNAAIGNFVFTGDTMSISDDANISLTIQGNSLGNNLNQILINPTSIDIYAYNTNPYSYSELYLDNSNVSAPYAQIIVDGNATPQQTWTFAADGTTRFPNDTIQTANNQSLTIRTPSSGNAYAIMYQSSGHWEAYAEDDNTGAYSAYAWIYAELPTANTPRVFIENVRGNDGLVSTWTFDDAGNLTLPGNTFAVNYANGNPVVISGGGAGLPLANGTSNINIATANGNVTVTAGSGNTWTFDTSGNLSFPTGLIIDDEDANTRIYQSSGNLKVTANNTATLRLGWSEFIAANAGGNVAQIIMNGTSAGQSQNVVVRVGNSSSTTYSWRFGDDGNLTLPGNIIAINYANGNRVTGNVTFSSEIVIGTGTSNLISGLYLAPSSSSANANMYLRVRGNINDEPTHIHFDTGNNQYYNQFIGDDNKYIQLANTGNIVINTNDNVGNSAQWNFDYNGILTLPGNSRVAPVGANIELQAAAGGYAEIVTSDGNNYVAVTTGGAEIVTSGAYIWAFNNAGNLTLPGNTFAVNYANGDPVVISGGAAGLPLANGTSNINIATANGNVTVTANGNTWTFAADSTITLPYNAVIKDTVYHAVAFGEEAGKTNQGQESVAIGHYAGRTTQGSGAVAIGVVAGNTSQGQNSVAIGSGAGRTSQAQSAVAIGSNAGSSYQGEDSIAIGYQAGYHDQQRGVAIGYQAGVGGTLYRSVSDAQGGSGPVTTYSPSAPPDPSRLYVASTANIAVSQLVFGNNIQANTVVTGIYPGEDRVDITPNYTAAMTDGDPLTFVGVVIGINDASNIVYPMRVTGTDIPANTFVQSTGCSTVTLNQYPTAPLADGASLVFNIGQGPYSTAVGYRAGQTFQADGAVAIGYSAGLQNQSQQAVAVGQFAGYSNQSANAVAVGTNAGEFTQAVNAVAVGYKAGYSTQGARAVAIGEDAGFQNQGEDAVAVGQKAGFQTQGRWAVAIGNSAGRSGQQDKAVSIGYGTGAVSQQDWAVAIGANAASYNQGYDAVAIGELAGNTSQGNNSIAIGYLSGYDTQGANSIAIGAMAGQSVQGNNSIILNATGIGLDAATANTFTVKPVRGDSTANLTGAGFKTVYYNSSTGEFAYSTD